MAATLSAVALKDTLAPTHASADTGCEEIEAGLTGVTVYEPE